MNTMCRRPDIVFKLKFINNFYVLVSANIFSIFFLQIKVACVVNINFFFMDWFCYNLIILFKECKILLKNLDKALLFSRNDVLCLKMWKLWRAPTTLEFDIFCWNFAPVSHLPVSTKGCLWFFILFYFFFV